MTIDSFDERRAGERRRIVVTTGTSSHVNCAGRAFGLNKSRSRRVFELVRTPNETPRQGEQSGMSKSATAVWTRRFVLRRVTSGVLAASGSAVAVATLSLASGASTAATTLKVTQNASWGPTLSLTNGDTVYAFAKDTKNKSNCSGACAVDWPPVLLARGQKTPDGVGVRDLGVIKRANGTDQVTYEGIPLYRFVGDKQPGQVNGNITAFGGRWRSVDPKSPRTPPTENSGTGSAGSTGGAAGTGGSGSTGGTGSTSGSGGATTTTTAPASSGVAY